MALSIENQLATTVQQQYESQQALWMDLGTKLLDNLTKLLALNMSAFNDLISESSTMYAQSLNAKTPQDLLAPRGAAGKPNIEKILTYGRNVGNIMARMQTVLSNAAQAQINETGRMVRALVETAVRYAPGGADSIFGLMKSAFDKSQGDFAQWTGKAKQEAAATGGAMVPAAPPAFSSGTKKAGSQPRQDNGHAQE